MKNILNALLATSIISIPVQSHSAEATPNKTLHIYNWSDYIGENTLENFEKETGIQIIYDVFDSYETVQGKLMPGNSGYDLVLLNAAQASPLIKAGVFLPLDKSKLPGWSNLDPMVLKAMDSCDPGVRHTMPYAWGTIGITYDVDQIKKRLPEAPVDSLSLIFDPKVVSHFADCGVTLLDSPTEVIPLVLTYLGRDPNSTATADIKAAKEVLLSIRPYIKKYDSVGYLSALPNGDQCMAMTYSGDYATATARAKEAGVKINLNYAIPREGSLIWFDDFYIPKDAPNADNAHAFIEYLLRPEVMAEITNYIRYANSNAAATALVDEAIRNDQGIYPDETTRQKLFAPKPQTKQAMRIVNRTWSTVKTGH